MKDFLSKKISIKFVLIIIAITAVIFSYAGYEYGTYKVAKSIETAFSDAFSGAFGDNTDKEEKKSRAEKRDDEIKGKIADKVEETYIGEKLELYDIQSKNYSSYLNGNVPGVDFKIKNNGDKTVTRIKVTAYFKNENDEIISEEDFLPVSSNSIYSDSSKPLKPNYIWQQEKGKFFSAKNVPSEWEVGNVEIKITDIELE